MGADMVQPGPGSSSFGQPPAAPVLLARQDRGVERALVLVALLYAVWALLFIWQSSFVAIDGKRYFCLFDDAMISMRYARNLVEGHGLVWNIGERVEGYTNLLMVLVMACVMPLAPPAVACGIIQLLGVLTGVAIATVSVAISRLVCGVGETMDRAGMVILASAVLFYYPLAFWTLSGMETGLVTFLVLTAAYCALRANMAGSHSYMIGTAVALGLAFLARPDTVLYAVVVGLWLAPAAIRPESPATRLSLYACAVYGVFVVGQSTFRLAYYGALLPNTYTLKLTGVPLGFRTVDGFWFAAPSMLALLPAFVLAALGLFVLRNRPLLLLLALAMTGVGYQIFVGGDIGGPWRLPVPVVPLLFVSALPGATVLGRIRFGKIGRPEASPASGRGPTVLRSICVGALLVAVMLVAVNVPYLGALLLMEVPDELAANRRRTCEAIAVDRLTTPAATIGVGRAGVIPFFTRRPAVDFLGRMDPYVARLPPDTSGSVSWQGMRSVPGHNKYDLTYSIVGKRPAFIEGHGWGREDVGAWVWREYGLVECWGLRLLFDRQSPYVRWELIDSLGCTVHTLGPPWPVRQPAQH